MRAAEAARDLVAVAEFPAEEEREPAEAEESAGLEPEICGIPPLDLGPAEIAGQL